MVPQPGPATPRDAGADQSALLARLGLWRVTRHPTVRRLYEHLDDRGVFLAQLDRFERPATVTGGGDGATLPDPPAAVTLTVERADARLPDRLADAPVAPADRVVLAWRDGEPVGHCLLSTRQVYVPELHRRLDPPGAYCWRLFVRRTARGRGIGRALVAAAVRWAAAADRPTVDTLTALVAPDNVPSRCVFATLGFRPVVRYTAVGLGGRRWDRRQVLRTDT